MLGVPLKEARSEIAAFLFSFQTTVKSSTREVLLLYSQEMVVLLPSAFESWSEIDNYKKPSIITLENIMKVS